MMTGTPSAGESGSLTPLPYIRARTLKERIRVVDEMAGTSPVLIAATNARAEQFVAAVRHTAQRSAEGEMSGPGGAGRIRLDQDSRTVTFTTGAVRLTRLEFALFVLLLSDTDRVWPFPDIQRRVWDSQGGDEGFGRVHAEISGAYAPGGEVVFVAGGVNYPDALAVSALAGSVEAPILLTRPDLLQQVTREELVRLAPQSVVVLGGAEAVSDELLEAVEATVGDVRVTRLAGTDRYGTAAEIAQEFVTSDVVYVASGENFPDALAVGAVAGAADAPLLLVRKDHLPAAARTELARLEPTRIVLVGGDSVVGEEVETALSEFAPVERVAGEDRYETATKLSAGLSGAEEVFVASGETWADALTGGARAAVLDGPLLLTKLDHLPSTTWDELVRLGPELVHLAGGEAVVSTAVEDLIRTIG